MKKIPRVVVGGIALPRLICGSNWFLGCSHTSAAKDRFIKEYFNREKIADILEKYLDYGVDAVLGSPSNLLAEAIDETQNRTGKKIFFLCTPMELKELDWTVKNKATFCAPHQSVVDPMIDVDKKRISGVEMWLRQICERNMVPFLSSHSPHAIICADNEGLDVATYTQPYNALGFLCQVETDWMAKIIQNARKPVIVIKPLAAGRLLPPTGLSFVWSTIRDTDLVCIGTMSPYEVEESVELSMAILEKRTPRVQLQKTRSKRTLGTS